MGGKSYKMKGINKLILNNLLAYQSFQWPLLIWGSGT